jgi:hypothetical protein
MKIPTGAIKIQEGLYLLETPFKVLGVEYIRRELYSADGYHFWERTQPENYNEDGELLPLEERQFATYAILSAYYTTAELINADFKSEVIE